MDNTGGAAFPHNDNWRMDSGMTLRDYFAAKALQGWLSSFGPDQPHPCFNQGEDGIAVDAYKLADAMIAERAK